MSNERRAAIYHRIPNTSRIIKSVVLGTKHLAAEFKCQRI
jgi:hypothetical protein